MATLNKLDVTAYTAQYALLGGGAAGPVTRDRATVLGEIAEGPLKTFLSRLPAKSWATLLANGKVSIKPVGNKLMVDTNGSSLVGGDDGGGNAAFVGTAGQNGTIISYEIRFIHSEDR